MKKAGFIATLITALLVVAFGWGSGYIALKGIQISQGTFAISEMFHKVASQTAAVVETVSDSINNIFGDDGTERTPASAETKPAKNTTGAERVSFSKPNELTIVIGGDIMFDRTIRQAGEQRGYESLFDPALVALLSNADLAVANLEGPITSQPSKTLVNGQPTKSLTFTFATSTALTLSQIGIDVVSLANNHTDNFLAPGYSETQRWLSRAGIEWFGNPWNGTSTSLRRKTTEEAEMENSFGSIHTTPITTIIRTNGFTVAFVGYHAFQTGIDRIISEIKRVSGPEVFTIVMPHWGEEYITKPSDRQKAQAMAFAQAGADAIIGAHPHVIMSNEWIDGIPVYYSLGNLLFDQYFSPEVMKGNIAELHLIKNENGIMLDKLSIHETEIVQGKGVRLVQ